MRVVSCTHLTATGQERPGFDVTLQGVDEGPPGKTLAPADSRLLPKTWEVRGLTRVCDTYLAVGRTAQVRPPPPKRPRRKLGGLGTVVQTRPWMGWLGRPLHAPMWPNQGGTTCCRVQPNPPYGLGQGGTTCCCWVQPDPPCNLGQGGTTCCRLQPGPPPPGAWAREGQLAAGYSLTPPVAWARNGRPAAVGCSLTPPVTWAREGRPAVGYSLDPPPSCG